MLPYHQPDERWHIFYNYTQDDFLASLVVPGLFNPAVPSEIAESFKLAEYIMAHAWYHYPLYDEALSKALRVLEMAVKLKCTQLGIQTGSRPLKSLMETIARAEPAKQLTVEFEAYRKIRNSFMHPSQHSYAGAMVKTPIINIINVINKLFLPENLFRSFSQKQADAQQKLDAFTDHGLCIFDYKQQRYLADDIKILAAIPVENNSVYLCKSVLVTNNTMVSFTDHSYAMPLFWEATGIVVSEKQVIFESLEENVKLELTNHPANITVHQQYLADKAAVSEFDRQMYDSFIATEAGREECLFEFKHLHKINPA